MFRPPINCFGVTLPYNKFFENRWT